MKPGNKYDLMRIKRLEENLAFAESIYKYVYENCTNSLSNKFINEMMRRCDCVVKGFDNGLVFVKGDLHCRALTYDEKGKLSYTKENILFRLERDISYTEKSLGYEKGNTF